MSADLTGRTFGRMTVVGPASEDLVLPQVAGGWWLGRCACSREDIAPAEAFLLRRLESCGRPTPEDPAAEEARLAALSRQRGSDMARSRYQVPWARFIRGDCACTPQAPCLVDFGDLPWRDRNQALARAGAQPSTGR